MVTKLFELVFIWIVNNILFQEKKLVKIYIQNFMQNKVEEIRFFDNFVHNSEYDVFDERGY